MSKLWGAVLLIVSANASAYIYDVKVASRWQPALRQQQYIIGYCDFHDRNNPANVVQRSLIEQGLHTAFGHKVHVIVEDLSSPNESGVVGCGPYYINSKMGILAGLANFCRRHQISVHNVEYRYCRVVALGPIIHNLSADPHDFSSTKKITIGQLLLEMERSAQELLVGQYAAQLHPYTAQTTASIAGLQNKLKLKKFFDQSLADYLTANTTPLNRLDTVKQLLTFDGMYVGLKMVHAILKNPDKEKIILIGGGTHINEAFEVLQKLGGYTLISKNSATPIHAPSISRSLGTPIFENVGGKPAAISNELLEHYLKN